MAGLVGGMVVLRFSVAPVRYGIRDDRKRSETVFVILREHQELEPHADLRQELLKRSIDAAIAVPRPAIPHKEAMAEMLKRPRPEPATWKKRSRR